MLLRLLPLQYAHSAASRSCPTVYALIAVPTKGVKSFPSNSVPLEMTVFLRSLRRIRILILTIL